MIHFLFAYVLSLFQLYLSVSIFFSHLYFLSFVVFHLINYCAFGFHSKIDSWTMHFEQLKLLLRWRRTVFYHGFLCTLCIDIHYLGLVRSGEGGQHLTILCSVFLGLCKVRLIFFSFVIPDTSQIYKCLRYAKKRQSDQVF